jgi:CheY-like chemotaxis protein
MKKTRILVIEDSTSIRASVVELLRIKEYEVESARNGILGLELVAEFEPDLIVCDIMMPELDGYQVLEAVRKVPKYANTPFVFLSA